MSTHKILVLSTDPLTERMPGPAIRAWHLAEQLAAAGHDVVLASTVACDRSHPAMKVRFADITTDLPDLERWMDMVVTPAGVLGFWPGLRTTDKIVVFDVYGPYNLEHLEPADLELSMADRAAELETFTAALLDHLACGDFFLCASERQRDFWLGQLLALRRVNPWTYDDDPTLRHLIAVVPFGLQATAPPPIAADIGGLVPGLGPDDEIVLWAGGVYNWFDPELAILAVAELASRRPRVKLLFLGAGHPNPAIPAMRTATSARALSDSMSLTGRTVFFNDEWVPYDRRSTFLLAASVGISTHRDHLETHYSFRTRVLDYIWSGLPMVLSGGDVLADLIDRRLGRAVRPGDLAALVSALEATLDNPPPPEAFVPIRESLVWSKVAEPLLRFCEEPSKAADRQERRRVEDGSGPPSAEPVASHGDPGRPPGRRLGALGAAAGIAVGLALGRRSGRR